MTYPIEMFQVIIYNSSGNLRIGTVVSNRIKEDLKRYGPLWAPIDDNVQGDPTILPKFYQYEQTGWSRIV